MSRLTADQEGGRLLLNDQAIPGVLQRVSVKHELATVGEEEGAPTGMGARGPAQEFVGGECLHGDPRMSW